MIYTHSLGRAARFYPQQTALVSEGKRLTFRQAHDRVENNAAALSRHGFQKGDRLANLLPNETGFSVVPRFVISSGARPSPCPLPAPVQQGWCNARGEG